VQVYGRMQGALGVRQERIRAVIGTPPQQKLCAAIIRPYHALRLMSFLNQQISTATKGSCDLRRAQIAVVESLVMSISPTRQSQHQTPSSSPHWSTQLVSPRSCQNIPDVQSPMLSFVKKHVYKCARVSAFVRMTSSRQGNR